MITLVVSLCAVILVLLTVIVFLVSVVLIQKSELEPLTPPLTWEDAKHGQR